MYTRTKQTQNESVKDKQKLLINDLFNQNKQSTFLFTKLSNYTSHRKTSPLKAKWTNKQKQFFLIYVYFLKHYFTNKEPQQIKWSIFKEMAKFVLTRNSQQCRSYYLKLIKKFKNIQNYLQKAQGIGFNYKFLNEQTENKLIQIQQSFKQNYIIENRKQIVIRNTNKQYNKQQIKANLIQSFTTLSFIQKNEKHQKNQQLKTADSYMDQQIPVKCLYQHKSQHSIFSKQSKFKPFTSTIHMSKKSVLPSFEDQEQQQDNFKRQISLQYPQGVSHKLFQIKYQIQNQNSIGYNNQFSPYQYITYPIYQTSFLSQQSENIKNYMQFQQYYYQMWASQMSMMKQQDNSNQKY